MTLGQRQTHIVLLIGKDDMAALLDGVEDLQPVLHVLEEDTKTVRHFLRTDRFVNGIVEYEEIPDDLIGDDDDDSFFTDPAIRH